MRTTSTPIAHRLFDLVFAPFMRRRLHRLHLGGCPGAVPPDTPLLLVANHVSWWDGFILREVQRTIRPGAALYTLMLDRELARQPILRWLGALGMTPGSPGSLLRVVRFLRVRRRSDPDLVVSFFPQGRIWPSHRRPLGFHEGLRLFADALAPVLLLPVGIHIEPLSHIAPSVFASLAEPLDWGHGIPTDRVERAVETELDRILAFLARYGEEAGDRWPVAVGRVPAG